MKKYEITVKVLLALLGVTAVACLAAFAYGFVQDQSQRGRREQLAAVRLEEEELRRQAAVHSEWQKLPGELQKFRSEHIISMDDYARFRRDLNLCLDDNGFPAPNIASQFSPGVNRLRKVSISFALEGSYRSLKKFIYEMERKQGIQFFRNIALNGSGSVVKGRFTMEVYLGE